MKVKITRSFAGIHGSFSEGEIVDHERGEAWCRSGCAEPAEGRRYEASGSWKTFYDGAEKVGSAQCTKEKAEAWVNNDVTLDEIN